MPLNHKNLLILCADISNQLPNGHLATVNE
jgi:hypothetical protein